MTYFGTSMESKNSGELARLPFFPTSSDTWAMLKSKNSCSSGFELLECFDEKDLKDTIDYYGSYALPPFAF